MQLRRWYKPLTPTAGHSPRLWIWSLKSKEAGTNRQAGGRPHAGMVALDAPIPACSLLSAEPCWPIVQYNRGCGLLSGSPVILKSWWIAWYPSYLNQAELISVICNWYSSKRSNITPSHTSLTTIEKSWFQREWGKEKVLWLISSHSWPVWLRQNQTTRYLVQPLVPVSVIKQQAQLIWNLVNWPEVDRSSLLDS